MPIGGISQNSEQTLKLSIGNSNVKAHQLSAGKVSEKIDAILRPFGMAWRLEKIPSNSAAKDDRSRNPLKRIAGRSTNCKPWPWTCTANWLRTFTTPATKPWIAWTSSRHWQKDADAQLAELSAMPENEDLQSLKILSGGFRELKPLVSQMRKLLRANSNARSFRLTESSNPKHG